MQTLNKHRIETEYFISPKALNSSKENVVTGCWVTGAVRLQDNKM